MEQCPEHTNLMVMLARIDERTGAQASSISEVKIAIFNMAAEMKATQMRHEDELRAENGQLADIKTDVVVLKRTAAIIATISAAVVGAIWNLVHWFLTRG